MRAVPLLMAFSFLVACQIPRPNTFSCIVNSPAQHLTCYNMKDDYDVNGRLNPGAKPTYFPATSVRDLNKSLIIPFSAPAGGVGIANLKAYIQKLREEYQSKCVIQ